MAATAAGRLPAIALLAVPVTKGWIYTLWVRGRKLAESQTFTNAADFRRAARIDAPGVPILEAGPGLQVKPFRWRS